MADKLLESRGPRSRRTPIDKGSYPITYSQERYWNARPLAEKQEIIQDQKDRAAARKTKGPTTRPKHGSRVERF